MHLIDDPIEFLVCCVLTLETEEDAVMDLDQWQLLCHYSVKLGSKLSKNLNNQDSDATIRLIVDAQRAIMLIRQRSLRIQFQRITREKMSALGPFGKIWVMHARLMDRWQRRN